jgi:hypothetical protein
MDRNAHKSILQGGAAPTALNDPAAMKRWDPWVRQTVAVTELTGALSYSPAPPDGFTLEYGGAGNVLVQITRPQQPFFVKQLDLVQSWAELRDERAAEILTQIDNQFAFINAVTGLNISRKRWTMEWLLVALQFTIEVELKFKHAFACYRPVDFSPQVQPIITTPGHSTYPMGHCTQCFATLVALAGLLKIAPADPAYIQLRRQARRISINRVIAGVHFPIDAAAGEMLGTTLGEYFLRVSDVAGAVCHNRTFAPNALPGNDPLNDYLGEGVVDAQRGGNVNAPVAITKSDYLKYMKDLALAEWDV